MPELPEVETIARDLNLYLKNQVIVRLEYRELGKMLRNPQSFFSRQVLKKKITNVFRRAKMLIIELNDGLLVFHLKMTGQLIYKNKKVLAVGGHPIVSTGIAVPNAFTHLTIHFKNGGVLYFNDIRKFGWVEYMNLKKYEEIEKKLGHEPFDKKLSFEIFSSLLTHRPRSSIKAALLDQKLIAGLGNIYVDEVLFKAHVRPQRKISTLNVKELKNIFIAIPVILNKSIKERGTTFSNFLDPNGLRGNFVKFLRVYGRKNEKCLVCGHTIQKIRVAGRGTHFCPHCQK